MKLHYLTIFIVAIAAFADQHHAERVYQRGGTNYIAKFEYGDSCFIPLTYPSGQPHYDAWAELWAGNRLIGTNIACAYTPNGCFEDSLDALLQACGQPVFYTNLLASTVTNAAFMTNWVEVPSLGAIFNQPETGDKIILTDTNAANPLDRYRLAVSIDHGEIQRVLNELAPYIDTIKPPPDPVEPMVNAVNIVPKSHAESLRAEADRWDKVEAVKAKFKALLEKINKLP